MYQLLKNLSPTQQVGALFFTVFGVLLLASVAAFLLSDLAGGVTAEITYVDGGFSHTAGISRETDAA